MSAYSPSLCNDAQPRMPSVKYEQDFGVVMDEPLTDREVLLLENIVVIAEMMEDEPRGFNNNKNPYDAGYQIALQNLEDTIVRFIDRNTTMTLGTREKIANQFRTIYESSPEREKHIHKVEKYWEKIQQIHRSSSK